MMGDSGSAWTYLSAWDVLNAWLLAKSSNRCRGASYKSGFAATVAAAARESDGDASIVCVVRARVRVRVRRRELTGTRRDQSLSGRSRLPVQVEA